MAPDPLDDLRRGARAAVFTGLGLGILGFQQVQVRRRELEQSLGIGLPPSPDELGRLVGRLTGRD
jgi:hypothetical protein